MTEVCGWVASHIHFSVGILAGRRANLMAVEKGRRNKRDMRIGRRKDSIVHDWKSVLSHMEGYSSFCIPEYRSVSATKAHRTPE